MWSHVQIAAVRPRLDHVPTALGRPTPSWAHFRIAAGKLLINFIFLIQWIIRICLFQYVRLPSAVPDIIGVI